MKNLFLLFILVASSMVLFPTMSKAKHIVGGEMYYDCLGVVTNGGVSIATFKITTNMYRDCAGGGADFDSDAVFGLFKGSGNNWEYIDSYVWDFDSSITIPVTDDPCIEEPPNICVQKAIYERTIELELIDESYRIVYQRCCRNETILNIVSPGEAGAVFEVEINQEAQKICNSSPQFIEFPPIVICAEKKLVFNHAASDVNGNTIVYEFCAPGASGGNKGSAGNPGDPTDCDGVTPSPEKCYPLYDNVIYKLPFYSVVNPMGVATNLQIHPQTGVITGTPQEVGQYVVGVCAKEYSNGVLLSVVRRDFQFNVTPCQILVNADMQNDDTVKEQEFIVNSCGDLSVDFINESTDEKYIDTYKWIFDLGNGETFIGNTRDVTVEFPDFAEYNGLMILNEDSAGCRDTAIINVVIYPEVHGDFTYQYDSCSAGPVYFKDNSVSDAGLILDWNWLMEDDTEVNEKNHFYQFKSAGDNLVQLDVVDINDCHDTINKVIPWYPAPNEVKIKPSQFKGCLPAMIKFDNLSFPVNESYDVLWKFGDSTSSTELNPLHNYLETGVYSVSLSVISPIGCSAEQTFPYLIQVLPAPVADFSYSPEYVTNLNNNVTFNENCEDAISWQYIINDTMVSYYQPNVTHMFQDTGIHKIDLIAIHPSGCTDTITKYIDVIPVGSLFLPNAFSPNNDGKNDVFIPKGDLFGISDYSIHIWNRWGEEVFISDNPREGWNGQKQNSNGHAPTGVYVYQLNYTGPRNEVFNYKGTITLIR